MKLLKIILLTAVILVLLPSNAFAADVLVKGKIIDAKEQPIGMSSISFINQEGQKVASTSTDSDGAYSVMIVQGTYTIEAEGPKGSTYKKTSLVNQTFDEDSVKNVTLSAGMPVAIGSIPWIPIIIIVVIVMIIILFLFLRRRSSLSS